MAHTKQDLVRVWCYANNKQHYPFDPGVTEGVMVCSPDFRVPSGGSIPTQFHMSVKDFYLCPMIDFRPDQGAVFPQVRSSFL